MGRKKTSCIYEYYEYDKDANISKCLIEDCATSIKGKHGANLLRHFLYKHKQEYEKILENNKENFPHVDPEPNLRNTEMVTKCLIDLVTVHGRPFELLEDEAFRNLISLIPMVDKASVTAHRIRELVEERADKLKHPEPQEPQGSLGNSREDPLHSDSDSSDLCVSETGLEEFLELGTGKKKIEIERNKCRFCGQFANDCIDVTDKDRPYLSRNKTTLTLNDLTVKLDFNDDSQVTVCLMCDRKLQMMFDFLKQLKEEQDSKSSIGDNVKKKVKTSVRMECESPTLSYNEVEIDKDDIIDPLTRTEAVFIKRIIKHKRRPVKSTPKRPKVSEKVIENADLMMDVKEETDDMIGPNETDHLE